MARRPSRGWRRISALISICAVAVSLLALVLAAGGSSAASEVTRLVGTVGPGFSIDLTDVGGKHVDFVVAGRYEVLVHDRSDIHNFVLAKKATGERPVETSVEFVGDMTFTANLTTGLWVYACSPHFDTMNGRLDVVAPAPPPSPPPAPPPKVERLEASVTATGVSLRPKTIMAGRYVVSVSDRSRSRGYHLFGPGVNRRTGLLFTGTATWRLRLRAGAYRFGNDRRLSGRLTVTAAA
jgi:plastocyanin